MLLLTAFIEVPLKDRDAIHSALVDVIASTRKEEGCHEYGCYEDTQQRGRYVFIERWRDQEALDSHFVTPHMAAWMKVLGPRLISARGLLYRVASMTEMKPK